MAGSRDRKDLISASKEYIIALLAGILLLGIFLRLFHLGTPSYWVDELNHVYAAQSLLKDGSYTLPSGVEYTRAAAYTHIVALAYRIFGEAEWVSRLPSALVGILTLGIVYWIVSQFLGQTVALISTLLLAVLPLEIGWGRLTRFYALLQLVTFLAIALVFMGLEGFSNQVGQSKRKWFEMTVGRSRVNLWILALAFLLFLLAFHLQVISAFVVIGIEVYAGFLFAENFISKREPFFWNRYFLFLVIGGAGVVAAWVIPSARNLIEYGIHFLPQWAKYKTAQDPMLFFKFIMGKDLFPLGVFFFLGIYQSIFDRNRFVLLSAFLFLTEILLFSFVFRYRMFQYIYNVFPFFVIVSAYSIASIFKSEWNKLQKQNAFWKPLLRKKLFFWGSIAAFILVTPLFREGISIPFRGDGQSDGAVTHVEWKAAKTWLRQNNIDQRKCVLISTLPLNLLYYAGQVDYDININDYAVAVENHLLNQNGRYYDMYSGSYFLLTAEGIDSVRKNNAEGFIVADTYRFLSSQYVKDKLRKLIQKSMKQVYLSPRKSIVIFHWRNREISNL